jgi:exodeoxyribonuclease-3
VHHGGDVKEAQPSYTQLAKRKPVIVCGDLNVAASPIDLKNPTANVNNPGFSQQERDKFRELLATGFVDTYRTLYPDKVEYSWWSYRFNARAKNIGWRIDYFLMSEFAKDMIVDAKIHTEVMGSDHCPVSLILNTPKEEHAP